MAKEELGLTFGALPITIAEQLKQQGFKFNEETVKHFQLSSDAITRLRIQGYISRSAADTAESKLFRKIIAHVNKENTLCLKN